MRSLRTLFSLKRYAPLLGIVLYASISHAGLALDINQAAEQVKSLPCRDGETVEQILDNSIKHRSQRDLGWRTFQETNYYDIERAVLINKSMELRFRWRVLNDGSIAPQNNRAKQLCNAT